MPLFIFKIQAQLLILCNIGAPFPNYLLLKFQQQLLYKQFSCYYDIYAWYIHVIRNPWTFIILSLLYRAT